MARGSPLSHTCMADSGAAESSRVSVSVAILAQVKAPVGGEKATQEISARELETFGNLCNLTRMPRGRTYHSVGQWFDPQTRSTAWQCLGREEYKFLKRSHEWRIDKWSRTKCISWACTLLLRHGSTYEAAQVYVAPDGTMQIEELLSFKMLRCLSATAQDIEDVASERRDAKFAW